RQAVGGSDLERAKDAEVHRGSGANVPALPARYQPFAGSADGLRRQPSRPEEVHMSDIAHPHPMRLRLRSSRLMLIAGLVLVVAATIVVIALSSGSSNSSSSTV